MDESDQVFKVLRRLGIWAFVCGISAVPSFLWAHQSFDRAAMVFGVLLFIAIYTVLSCTPYFERIYLLPHVRKTLYIGYWVRIGLSIAFPLGMGIDLIPGLISLNIVNGLGLTPESFGGTFTATLIQGTILNFILTIFMLIVYAIIRAAAARNPIEQRGFEVMIPEARIAQGSSDPSVAATDRV